MKNVSSSMIEIFCYEADIAIKMVPIERAQLARHFDVRFLTFLIVDIPVNQNKQPSLCKFSAKIGTKEPYPC